MPLDFAGALVLVLAAIAALALFAAALAWRQAQARCAHCALRLECRRGARPPERCANAAFLARLSPPAS